MAVSSLYEGLEVETKRPPLAGGDSSDIGWFHDDTSRMKFMSSQLQRTKILKDRLYSQQNLPKSEQQQQQQQQQLYPEDELPPPVNNTLKSPIQDPPNSSPMITEIPLVADSYNPMNPNDYEDFARDRAIRREIERLECMKKEEEARKRKQHEEKKRRHRRRSSSGSDSDGERWKKMGQKGLDRAAIPPPPNLSGETAVEMSESSELDLSNPSKGALLPKGLSVAANIMSKYGWKEGMGLGKESQGMSRALVVEKTSRRGGKILPNTPNTLDPEKSAQVLNQLKNPSKILLLQNMVGRGQVDEELNDEVSEECTKYGEVVKVIIFEIPEGVPDEESVRIFIEFARNESTIKAYVDLNGRYFAGRVVKGSFFDEERFANMDLGPIPLV